jgi:hypothetical protein
MDFWPDGHSEFTPNVPTVLKQRGFVPASCCDAAAILDVSGSDASIDGWLDCLGKPSVRKLIRRIVQGPGAARRSLQPICAEPRLSEHLQLLQDLGILTCDNETVRATKTIDNFGPTLEWYVSKVISREFEAASCWSVQVEHIYGGGDFDVLSWMDSQGTLVYVECKSASPESVSNGEIRHFLQRCQELGPEVAIMLVDTDSTLCPLLDRIQDILLPLQRLASGIRDEDWRPDRPFIAPIPHRDYTGLYFGLHRVFVTGSEPSITTQLRKCLRYYSSWVRHLTFYSPVRTDYIRGVLMVN